MMDRTSVRRNGRRRWLCALAVLSAAVPRPASRLHAQAPEPSEVVASLDVEADARCATTDALIARVHARSARIRFTAESDGIAHLVVRIEQRNEGDFVAGLFVEWPNGQRAERRLSARSCASALDALGLLVAMTLDPGTRSGAGSAARANDDAGQVPTATARAGHSSTPKRATQETPPPNDAAPAAEVAEQTPIADARTVAEPAPSPGPSDTSDSDASDAPTSAPEVFGLEHIALGAHARLWSGPTPLAMYGIGVHGALAFQGAGLWTPALQLQLSHAWVNQVTEAGGAADFALDSAQLDACPAGLRLSPLTARVCMTGTVGRLHARGYDSYTPQTHTKLWASLGGGLLLTLGLGDWLLLQGSFELTAPISRYAFAFRPEVFHRVPELCLAGHLGAGVRFP